MSSIRELERESIERFFRTQTDKLRGQVMDIGCGKQPYRHIVEQAGGTYHGFDRPSFPGSVVDQEIGEWWDAMHVVDTVMMTQVWQYIPMDSLQHLLFTLGSGEWSLKRGGWFLVTGPTNWPLVETVDLHRFTTAGVARLLREARFEVLTVDYRASIAFEGEDWPLGWQAIARARA